MVSTPSRRPGREGEKTARQHPKRGLQVRKSPLPDSAFARRLRVPHQRQDVDIRNCAICRYATLRGRPAVFGPGCAERDTISVPPFVHLSKLSVSIGRPHGTACLVQQLVIRNDDACSLTTMARDKVQVGLPSPSRSGFHACSCRTVCVLGERFQSGVCHGQLSPLSQRSNGERLRR